MGTGSSTPPHGARIPSTPLDAPDSAGLVGCNRDCKNKSGKVVSYLAALSIPKFGVPKGI